jgi:hypothetical protein
MSRMTRLAHAGGHATIDTIPLDDRTDLLAVAQDLAGERPQGVRVWVNG